MPVSWLGVAVFRRDDHGIAEKRSATVQRVETTGRVLMDEIIRTDYGQFDFVWDEDSFGFDGEFDRFFAGQVNGLVGAANPQGMYVNLARRSGGSHLQLVLHHAEPPPPPSEWEDVVEVSVQIPDGAEVRWVSWAAESSGEIDGLSGGSYRARISARGRDSAAANEFADTVLDHYRVELWPAPPADDEIVRVGSENATYWHREVGGRR